MFDDEDLESSPVVELFLDALSGSLCYLPEPDRRGAENLLSAIDLADKYECQKAIRALSTLLPIYAPLGKAFKALKKAAIHECYDICATILLRCGGYVWTSNSGGRSREIDWMTPIDENVFGCYCLDPATWTESDASQIPNNLMFALLRSFKIALKDNGYGDQLDKEELSTSFWKFFCPDGGFRTCVARTHAVLDEEAQSKKRKTR